MRRLLLLAGLVPAACIQNNLHGLDTSDVHGADSGDDTALDSGGDTENPFEGMGAVKGRICAPNDNTWVGGAKVWTELQDGTIRQTMSDSEGWFLLEGLPPGIHTVRAQKGSFGTTFEVEVFADFVTELAIEECLEGEDVDIVVITGIFDSIERIIDRLGLGYDLVDGVSGTDYIDFLRDPEAMATYDILIINCRTNEAWEAYEQEIGQNIADFVMNGGSVYVSDQGYWYMEKAFPAASDYAGDDNIKYAANMLLGPTELNAEVVDQNLQVTLGGDDIYLVYEEEGLYAAMAQEGSARVLIRDKFTTYDWVNDHSGQMDGILAAELEAGSGKILFTSFHNVYQESSELDPLLEQLVLSL